MESGQVEGAYFPETKKKNWSSPVYTFNNSAQPCAVNSEFENFQTLIFFCLLLSNLSKQLDFRLQK